MSNSYEKQLIKFTQLCEEHELEFDDCLFDEHLANGFTGDEELSMYEEFVCRELSIETDRSIFSEIAGLEEAIKELAVASKEAAKTSKRLEDEELIEQRESELNAAEADVQALTALLAMASMDTYKATLQRSLDYAKHRLFVAKNY